ncbi:MAG: hypothetical protein ACREUQ_05685, partial [Burkholderiales bacterium]
MNTRSGRVALRLLCTALACAVIAGCAAPGDARRASVQRMYVFECGQSRTPDVSRWSPGVDVGKPREFSDNCYLIQHAKGLMLWDSGMSDSIAD